MDVSLYTAAAAMTANARWQELITENLAATSVPGFKRQDLAAEVVESGLSVADGAATDFVMPQMVARTNFTQGEMRVTGVNTDVAIDGVGFFEVELPDGTLGYTRDGEFHVNGQGDLVTKEGFTVMGENGPIQFDLNLGGALPNSVHVAETGEVSQGGEVRGSLRVVEFNYPGLLTQANGGIFLAQSAGLQEVGNPTSRVQGGALEQANTSPVMEMANMMLAMRSFETNQRIVQILDSRLGETIDNLTPA